jgi:hypothetical protein
MTSAEPVDADIALFAQIRGLVAELSDDRSRAILRTVVDAVALNPQPLPPATQEILRSMIDAVALNPQPLPPERLPE